VPEASADDAHRVGGLEFAGGGAGGITKGWMLRIEWFLDGTSGNGVTIVWLVARIVSRERTIR
jgi:hypothetical protein